MENVGRSIRGIYRDAVINSDGRVIHDSGWVSNTIVNRCRILLAGFINSESTETPQGIQYLAVGQGLEKWDTENGPPSPNPVTDQLVTRYDPPILAKDNDLEIVYLNENDVAVPGPTSRLQITATLKPGYPEPLADAKTYPLREFGLFGKFGNTDYMINCVRHPVIHKDAASTLVRVIRLQF